MGGHQLGLLERQPRVGEGKPREEAPAFEGLDRRLQGSNHQQFSCRLMGTRRVVRATAHNAMLEDR
jgi:hypothetical protein